MLTQVAAPCAQPHRAAARHGTVIDKNQRACEIASLMAVDPHCTSCRKVLTAKAWEENTARSIAGRLYCQNCPRRKKKSIAPHSDKIIRGNMDYCPTPEEIAAECQKIQAEWTEEERHYRTSAPNDMRCGRKGGAE